MAVRIVEWPWSVTQALEKCSMGMRLGCFLLADLR